MKARVIGFVAEVCIEQNYINEEILPIEAVYFFPTEEGAAVVEFTANVDGRIIKSEAKEKAIAKKEYEDAKKANKTAILMEQHRPDIFNIQIGQLKPKAEAVITMKYVTELPVDNGKIRLTIPTTIAPRYCPRKNNDVSSPSDESGEEISSILHRQTSPAPLDVEVTVIMKSRIKAISSPSHNITNNEGEPKFCNGTFIAKSSLPGGDTTEMDRDLVVLIQCEDATKPVAFVEKGKDGVDGDAVVMVSFVPSFQVQDDPKEVIFLVDRSRSMSGSSMDKAKLALEYFIRSLPTSCFFNIVSFGSSSFSVFRDGSKEYNETSMQKALESVKSMTANMGGTEIYEPLNKIFNEKSNSGLLRQIIVLTDGEVSNEDSILDLVGKHSHLCRVYSLGIGSAASRYLVKGLARVGGGTAEFTTYNEDLRPKVLQLLKNALQPYMREVRLWWQDRSGQAVDENNESDAPTNLRPLHDGDRMLIYRKFDASTIPAAVTLSAESPDGPFSYVIQISKEDTLDFSADIVHRLAARKRIQELEEGKNADGVKKKIISLATKYHLASKFTSFVGIDTGGPEEGFHEATKMIIPNQIPFGYGDAEYDMPECRGMRMSAPRMMCSPPMRSSSPRRMSGSPSPSSQRSSSPLPPAASACPPPMTNSSEGFALSDWATSVQQSSATCDTTKDLLTRLLDQQSFEGAFAWSDVFKTLLGKTQAEIESTTPKELSSLHEATTTTGASATATATTIWFTAIAIQIMKLKMQEKRVLWELVVLKSLGYLLKTLKGDQMVKSVLEKAKKVVEN